MFGRSIIYQINYLWRLGLTGFCFILFGLGGLFLSLIAIPAISVFIQDKINRRRRVRAVIRWCFRGFFRIMHFGGVLSFNAIGLEKCKDDRGMIVVANHPSLIDVVALMMLLPNVNCIVKKSLFDNFFLKGVVRGAGYIPNDESENILLECKKSLLEGDNIIIFPEGTRTVPGEPIKLKRGAAQIAYRLGAPLRLVHIQVQPDILTKGLAWYKIPAKRALFSVQVGGVIPVEEMLSRNLPPSIAARQITEEIRVNIDSRTTV